MDNNTVAVLGLLILLAFLLLVNIFAKPKKHDDLVDKIIRLNNSMKAPMYAYRKETRTTKHCDCHCGENKCDEKEKA